VSTAQRGHAKQLAALEASSDSCRPTSLAGRDEPHPTPEWMQPLVTGSARRYLHHQPMIFATNEPLAEWGRVLHAPGLVEAIADHVRERGRHLPLR